MRQPGAYIRSRELGSVVEGAHSSDARKAKGWLDTNSVMPRKVARHNRSSGIARLDARMTLHVAERSQPKPPGTAMLKRRQPAWGRPS